MIQFETDATGLIQNAKVSQMAITKAFTEREIPNVIPVNESDETVKKSFPGVLE